MDKLLTIAKNTFTETLRQPIYGVIVGIALFLYLLSPSLTMYTMDDDNKLLREIGLSTLFLTSLFIAIFAASGAVAEELENKTILTVLSKPISRPLFILAKFMGVCGAVALAHFVGTIALLMAIRHGVLESASDTHDTTVLVTAGVSIVTALLLGLFFSYAYDRKFSTTAITSLAILGALSMVFLAFVDRHWKVHPADNGISMTDVYAAGLLFFGAVVIAALALAFSTRFNIVVTLSACIGVFLLGLVSDYVFGRMAETHVWARIGRYLVPNLQLFWISDAIYEDSKVSLKYIGSAALYAICYAGGILAIAIGLFQRRQVG
jgi:ABC-type transport system involved in multi-copper enzyme maturation permease subunit